MIYDDASDLYWRAAFGNAADLITVSLQEI